MTTTINNQKGEQFQIDVYFYQEFKGRGGWHIKCEVAFKSDKKIFSHYTTDSMFFDEISDMKANDNSWYEIQNAYKEKSFAHMEENILDWCEEIKENQGF